MHLPAFLIALLLHLHLTALEPVIMKAIVIAKNPVVRKDVRAAVKFVDAVRQQRNKKRP